MGAVAVGTFFAPKYDRLNKGISLNYHAKGFKEKNLENKYLNLDTDQEVKFKSHKDMVEAFLNKNIQITFKDGRSTSTRELKAYIENRINKGLIGQGGASEEEKSELVKKILLQIALDFSDITYNQINLIIRNVVLAFIQKITSPRGKYDMGNSREGEFITYDRK